MAYSSGIPDATDRPQNSQPLLKANFTAISTVVAVNHVAFDDPSGDQGKHKFVAMPEQTSAPTPGANELTLYSRESAYTSVSEMAFRRESSGDIIEFTSSTKDYVGWTILPSGILIKWGRSSPATGLTTITWTTGATIPVFSAVYNVGISPLEATAGDVDVAVRLVSFSTTNIVAYVSKRTTTGAAATATTLYFYAIGIPA